MLRQHYAERSSSEQPDTDQPSAGRVLPQWQITTRRWLAVTCERILGECWAPNPRTGLLVLLLIIVLLGIIAVTLSIGNALLVLVVAAVMRIACERRWSRSRSRD
ncbi:MAG TPA: hypothetical protein VFX16_17250 [Pseudonocardiaceae bacterium]|nr:hypothetical protein [Pseudonocardiaceae bacterium]